MKRLICLILISAVTVLSFSGCAGSQTFTAEKNTAETALKGTAAVLIPSEEQELICKNGDLSLYYGGEGITVKNETDASEWKSYMDESSFADFATSTDTWKSYMQSVASVTYISKNSVNGNFNTEHSAAKSNGLSVKKYANGLEIKIDYAKSKISLTVEITLDKDSIAVRIPAEKIEENGEFYLYSVELLPFMLAGGTESDGYIFYPDGCGALSLFSKTGEKSKFAQPLTLDVYGTEETRDYFKETNNPSAKLPVCGIKNGSTAFLAAVTSGESDAQINVNPAVGMSALPVNRSSLSLIFRRRYTVELAQIKSSKTKEKSAVKLNEDLLDCDRTVKYFLLSGDSADYSGMANAYREYLIKQNILDGKNGPGSKTVLKFFMGAPTVGDTYQGLVKTTGFSDAEEILEEYKEEGVTGLTVILKGWQSGGYGDNLTSYSPESRFGGKKRLKRLNSFAGENGVRLLLEIDPMLITDGTGFFIKGKNTVADGAGSPVTDTEQRRYISNRNYLQKNVLKALKKTGEYGSADLLIAGIGESVYSDLSSSNAAERYEMQQLFESLFEKSGENTAASGGNLYALKFSDFIDKSPQGTSDSLIEDMKIPWYQMVVHGSASYTTETGNSSYDLNLQKLKWIEYGAVPYFEITKENPSALRDTRYTQLFSSENSEWKEKICDIYREFNGTLDITDGFIIKHEYLAGDVVLVKYGSGAEIVLNYTGNDYLYEGRTVPAEGYAVIKEGENEKKN